MKLCFSFVFGVYFYFHKVYCKTVCHVMPAAVIDLDCPWSRVRTLYNAGVMLESHYNAFINTVRILDVMMVL
jgi:hypothetical protein